MKIGIHIRLQERMSTVAQKALRLDIPIFQTFALNARGHFYQTTPTDKKRFLSTRAKFGKIFLHASYWVNCASTNRHADQILERELALASELAFDYYVIHPGAITRQQSRDTSLTLIAQRIAYASKQWPAITILIENVAHTNRTIGGNLSELGKLAQLLDHRHNVGFCIDTAHAFAYGYDITTPELVDTFINTIDREIGLDRIPLIHLNDTAKLCGSHLDVHTIPAKGNVGQAALAHLYKRSACKHKKFIIELPPFAEDKEKAILSHIREW